MPKKFGYGYGFENTALAKGRKQLKEFRKRTKPPVSAPVKPSPTPIKSQQIARPAQPVSPATLKTLDKDIAEFEKAEKQKKRDPLDFSKPAAYGGSD